MRLGRSLALVSVASVLVGASACESGSSGAPIGMAGTGSAGGGGGSSSSSSGGGQSAGGKSPTSSNGGTSGGAHTDGGAGDDGNPDTGGASAGGGAHANGGAGGASSPGTGGVHAGGLSGSGGADGRDGGPNDDAGSGNGTGGATSDDGGADGSRGGNSGHGDSGSGPREFAYVSARFNGGGVSVSSLDLSNGKLERLSNPSVASKGAVAVAVHSAQKFVVVAGENNHLETYRVAADGSLPAQPASVAAFPEAIATMALDPKGRFVYVATTPNFNDPPHATLVSTYRIDPDTGDLLELLPLSLGSADHVLMPQFIAVDPTGTFAYFSLNEVGLRGYRIDPTSGKLTELPDSPFPAAIVPNGAGVFGGAIVFKPSGDFLYTAGGGLNAFSIDRTTGKLDLVAGSPFSTEIQSDPSAPNIAVAPGGEYLYATKFSGLGPAPSIYGFAIQKTTGALTPVPNSPIRNVDVPYSIAVDPSRGFVLVGEDFGTVGVFSLDRSNGAFIREVEGSPFPIGGLEPKIAFTTLP